MNKKCFAIVFLSIFFICFQAAAQPKIDAMSGVERVFGTVLTKVEEVMKKVNSAAKSFEENLLGDSLKTNYETFMALKQSIQEQYAAGKEAYENAKSAYNEGLKMYNEGKAYAEGEIGTITGLHEEAVKKLQALKVSSPEVLEARMTDLKSQMNDRRDSMAEELEARLRVANENVDVLEKMYGEISDKGTREMILVQKAEASMIRAQYEADYEKLLKQEEDYVSSDREYQAMQDEYNEMASIMAQIQEAAKEKGLSLGASFLQGLVKKTKAQKKDEYQALGEANFVTPNEPFNQAAVDRITKERGDKLVDDVASSFAHIINERAAMQKADEKADEIADNVADADYAITRKRLNNEQEIEKLRQLQRKLETTASDLKMKTSNNMFRQGLRQLNPNKDPSELKLDNYNLTKEELQDIGLGN